jgi:hypothetical protein
LAFQQYKSAIHQYFSNAEQHLDNPDRISVMQIQKSWISWFLTEYSFQSCYYIYCFFCRNKFLPVNYRFWDLKKPVFTVHGKNYFLPYWKHYLKHHPRALHPVSNKLDIVDIETVKSRCQRRPSAAAYYTDGILLFHVTSQIVSFSHP